MSEALSVPRSPRVRVSALTHAGEVAQWTAQLLAWLWLGQQGTRLGWSLASGVMAVAIWWAMRVMCRGSTWAFRGPSWGLGALGLATATGVVLIDLWASAFGWATGPLAEVVSGAHAGLCVVAAVWGVWSAWTETRSQFNAFEPGRLAWHPLLATGALGVVWLVCDAKGWVSQGLPVGIVGAILALCAGVLYARDCLPHWRARACRGSVSTAHQLLAPSAMGLMMGSLWLGHDWCLGRGWGEGDVVAAHVALMAALPACVAMVSPKARQLLDPVFQRGADAAPMARDMVWVTGEWLVLALMAAGGLMWLGVGTAYGVWAMVLQSLAWALHCNRTRVSLHPWRPFPRLIHRAVALLLGPMLLIWVGVVGPALGPLAMQTALMGLGALAALSLASALSGRRLFLMTAHSFKC